MCGERRCRRQQWKQPRRPATARPTRQGGHHERHPVPLLPPGRPAQASRSPACLRCGDADHGRSLWPWPPCQRTHEPAATRDPDPSRQASACQAGRHLAPSPGRSDPAHKEAIMNRIHRLRRTMARRTSPAGRVEPHASRPKRPRTPPGQPARPRQLRRMVHPGPSGSRQRRNRPELARSHHHDASAAHDARTPPAAAHRPALHPLPAKPGQILGQPQQRPDGTPPMVPVRLPATGPALQSRDPVQWLEQCENRHAAAAPVLACRAHRAPRHTQLPPPGHRGPGWPRPAVAAPRAGCPAG